MRIYLDSSALIKRAIMEAESSALVAAVDAHHEDGDLLLASSLAWIEVSRALRSRSPHDAARTAAEVEAALSGVAEHPMTTEVVSLARRVSPQVLRTLDAIHLASALLVDADLVITYDERLAAASEANSLAVSMPT